MDHNEEIRRLEEIADWMDSRFGVPGTRLRFGLDSLLGLIPGVGDAASVVPAVYVIHRAERLGAPLHLLLRMAANLSIDLLIGAIPLAGDLFDFGFKSNRRNVALLKSHVENIEAPRPDHTIQQAGRTSHQTRSSAT